MQLVITTNIAENVFSEISGTDAVERMWYFQGTVHLLDGESQIAPYLVTKNTYCFFSSCAQLHCHTRARYSARLQAARIPKSVKRDNAVREHSRAGCLAIVDKVPTPWTCRRERCRSRTESRRNLTACQACIIRRLDCKRGMRSAGAKDVT
jgi:hypothetical protein